MTNSWNDLKVTDLRAELSKRDLSTKGLKSELVERLTLAVGAERGNGHDDEEEDRKVIVEEEQAGGSSPGESRNGGAEGGEPEEVRREGGTKRERLVDSEEEVPVKREKRERRDSPSSEGGGNGEGERRRHGDEESSSKFEGQTDERRRSRRSSRHRDSGDEHERSSRRRDRKEEEGHRRERRMDERAEEFLNQLRDHSKEDYGERNASRDRDDRDREHRSSRRDDRRRRHRDVEEDDRDRRRRDRGDRPERGDRSDRGDRSERDRGDRSDRDRSDRRRSRREEFAPRRSRRSSRSGSPRHRSRSRSVTPLHKRPKKLHNWDVVAPGFEHMTTAQAKETGAFPLPGQPGNGRATAMAAAAMSGSLNGMDPARAAMMMQHDLPPRPMGMDPNRGNAGALPIQSASRQARRLYVGQIPYGINEDAMMDFFNEAMLNNGLNQEPGNPVISVQINHEKNYAFVEFRTPSETTAAVAFDGIQFQGQCLKIRRPKDYIAPTGDMEKPPTIHLPGVISTNVPDGPNKIFIGGLPPYLNEDQVIELLKSFGELRAFNLVKDTMTGLSKGFAFCEYVDQSNTDIAIQGLNNMELGDKRLVVQRASVGSRNDPMMQRAGIRPGILPGIALGGLAPALTGAVEPTTVLQLLNMVTVEELMDDEDYQDILEDVQEECSKFGTILEVKIPRPVPGQEDAPGVGKIFVRYQTIDESTAALRSLAGRKFAERTVLTSFIKEEDFESGNF